MLGPGTSSVNKEQKMETKNFDYFNRTYSASDISSETVILVFETYGLACGPASFSFLHLLKSIDELPLFLEAYASVDGSEDEMTLTMPIGNFLAEHQAELLDDFNLKYEEKLPEGYKFELPGDEELVAKAINAHNVLQF